MTKIIRAPNEVPLDVPALGSRPEPRRRPLSRAIGEPMRDLTTCLARFRAVSGTLAAVADAAAKDGLAVVVESDAIVADAKAKLGGGMA